MTLRRAVEADLAEVMRLERETATAPQWAAAEYRAMLGAGRSGGMQRALFVVAEGRVLQGFAAGKVVGSGGEAELESVVVRSTERRQGLGSALCRAVMRWSRSEAARAIMLEVRVGSSGAIRLYSELGFVAVGRRGGYYREPVEDAMVMRCELGDVSGAVAAEAQ